jgi:predicted Fe-Mo cluster-binding NifX family protein
MERIAIPLFHSRVAPVLDTSNLLIVVDLEDGQELVRRELSLEKMSLFERVESLCRLEVNRVICAAISETMFRLIESKKIELISGVVGDLDKVIQAYLCDLLDDVSFSMPGSLKPVTKYTR